MREVEGRRLCQEFSAGYYGLCTVGGMLSAGTTHLAITPFDVLKVNMQVTFGFCCMILIRSCEVDLIFCKEIMSLFLFFKNGLVEMFHSL